MDFSNILVFAGPLYVSFILIELMVSRSIGLKSLYNWRDLGASTLVGVGTAVIGPLLNVFLVAWLLSTVYELFNPVINGMRMNILGYESLGWAWYIWLLCQFLDDFSFYWYHRLSHTVRLFWAAHLPHHSSEHFNFGTGIRIGWFVLLYKPIFYLWLVAIGFHFEMVMICMAIETIYQFQLHTKFVPRLGALEYLFVTHTQHQVHHARNIEYLDKNHGGILSIFDRLFGTFRALGNQNNIEFGVLHPPNSYNPLIVVTHEFKDIWQDVKNANSIYSAIMYIFGPPGWSHDNSRKTTRQLQKEQSEF
jgi:sterol desaturase/sphingolipid hydroxylase (fatty acid hydroxylase superfamily)